MDWAKLLDCISSLILIGSVVVMACLFKRISDNLQVINSRLNHMESLVFKRWVKEISGEYLVDYDREKQSDERH